MYALDKFVNKHNISIGKFSEKYGITRSTIDSWKQRDRKVEDYPAHIIKKFGKESGLTMDKVYEELINMQNNEAENDVIMEFEKVLDKINNADGLHGVYAIGTIDKIKTDMEDTELDESKLPDNADEPLIAYVDDDGFTDIYGLHDVTKMIDDHFPTYRNKMQELDQAQLDYRDEYYG